MGGRSRLGDPTSTRGADFKNLSGEAGRGDPESFCCEKKNAENRNTISKNLFGAATKQGRRQTGKSGKVDSP